MMITFKTIWTWTTWFLGLTWLILMSEDIKDWDVGVSIVMATTTLYLMAGFHSCVTRLVEAPFGEKISAVVIGFALGHFCVDGVYFIYWSLAHPTNMLRQEQYLTSWSLFLCCYAVWEIIPRILKWDKMK